MLFNKRMLQNFVRFFLMRFKRKNYNYLLNIYRKSVFYIRFLLYNRSLRSNISQIKSANLKDIPRQ